MSNSWGDLPPVERVHRRIERRKFLGYVGRLPFYALVADVLAEEIGRSHTGMRAQVSYSETINEIPGGTYNLSEILTSAGTEAERVRYRVAPGEAVTIRGGGTYNQPWTILDGSRGTLIIDGRLRPVTPPTRAIESITASNIRIEYAEFVGPIDWHRGYQDATGATVLSPILSWPASCAGRGNINGSAFGGTAVDVVIHHCIIHGFNDAFRCHGGYRIERTLIRNNWNGINLDEPGVYLEMIDSAMWDTVNHQFECSLSDGGRILADNCIFAVTQDMIKSGVTWSGVDELVLTHNLWWMPQNHDSPGGPNCASLSGLQLEKLRKRGVIRDNIFVSDKETPQTNLTTAQLRFVESDYNLYLSGQSNLPFELNGVDKSFADWRVQTAALGYPKDVHSIYGVAPVFFDEPAFRIPMPRPGNAENSWGFYQPTGSIHTQLDSLRAKFILQTGSPGKHAASDGLDMGIRDASIRPAPPEHLRIVR